MEIYGHFSLNNWSCGGVYRDMGRIFSMERKPLVIILQGQFYIEGGLKEILWLGQKSDEEKKAFLKKY